MSTGAWAKQGDQETADAAITTSGGIFSGIMVIPGNSYPVTVDVYDNATAASGTKLIPTTIVYAASSAYSQSPLIKPPVPVRFYNGIYVDITVNASGSVAYMVYWESN